MHVNPNTEAQLGWDDILEHWAACALTPYGQTLCRQRAASDAPAEIARWQKRATELNRLQDEGRSAPLGPVENIDEELQRAAKGGILDGPAILRVAEAMQVSSRVRRFLLLEGEQAGLVLLDLARGSHDLQAAGRDLKAAFDEEGQLRDSASLELQQLRRAERNLADGIRARLERMMRSSRVAPCLQEDFITQRADRYVLPVRSDSRTEIPGLVHDTSNSGATLFIEPTELIDSGNRLKIARAAVEEEIRRILAEYSREIIEHSEALQANLEMLAEFDALAAAVELGRKMKGRFIEVEGQGFELRRARHPGMVLAGQNPVPNDIHLPDDRRALVLSGPNAGGKTVAMKTLGLFCLMAQRGLPVPADEGSRICRFAHLASVIGDAQDISRGLSTFSAHVEQIAHILDKAGPGSLVLLDEIAADTDPRHGAALACGILQSLVDRGATVMTTTHYEELKQLPFEDERFANASVGFDLERMEPSFVLHPEVPGRSLTLDIARRLGMPEEVLDKAAGRLDGSERQLDAVLQSLERERQGLEDMRDGLRQARQDADEARRSHREAAESLRQRKTELLGQGRQALLTEIASVRRQVAGVIESMRRPGPMSQAVEASRELIGLEKQVRDESARVSPSEERWEEESGATPSLASLEVGQRVWLSSMGQEARVASVDRKTGMVGLLLGLMRTRAPLEKLRLIHEPTTPKPRHQKTLPAEPAEARPVEVRSSLNSLDLRGQRVDEAIDAVEKFLDEVFGRGETAAFIIHGHGTGALRAAVREHLKASPYPRHFRSGAPEEGGDGVTVVRLK